MSDHFDRFSELDALLGDLRDGLLDDDKLNRLDAILADDPEAVQYYVEFIDLFSTLTREPNAWSNEELGAANWQRGLGTSVPSESPTIFPIPDLTVPHSSFLIHPSSAPLFASHSLLFSYVVATLILSTALAIAWAWKLPDRSQIANQSRPAATDRSITPAPKIQFVGQITGMVDCQWADATTATLDRAHVPLGRKYAMASGLMEITYYTGAKVILQGPVTYEVESPAGGYLSIGKLTARVEKKEERRTKNEELSASRSSFLIPRSYFAVRTPSATVTDLGTEFGVEVTGDGACEVHVIEGQVSAARTLPAGSQGEENLLSANQAIRLDPNPNKSAAIAIVADLSRFTSMRKQLVRQPPLLWPILDKTLVAWVSLDNLEQRGVGVFSVINMPEFDGIVFGEIAPTKWMAGGHLWLRTERDQSAYPNETASPSELVCIAVVYNWTNVTVYRNGVKYVQYSVEYRQAFQRSSILTIGKRHIDTSEQQPPTLAGTVEEARLYNVALSPQAIASLKPNEPSPIGPVGCWNFEDGTARDSTGHFPMGELHGNAKINHGKLILDGADSYLLVPSALNHNQQTSVDAKARNASNRDRKEESRVEKR